MQQRRQHHRRLVTACAAWALLHPLSTIATAQGPACGDAGDAIPEGREAPTRQEVLDAMNAQMTLIQECVGEGGLAEDAAVRVQLELDGDTGAVSSVRVVDGPAQLRRCLRSALGRACVPPFRQAKFAIEFPLRFARRANLDDEPPPREASAMMQAEVREAALLSARVQLGVAFGGSPLTNTPAPDCGDGLSIELGLFAVPLWLGRVGLGASLDGGFKYASGQSLGGGYGIRRFPLSAVGRVLVDLGRGALLHAGGGARAEFGVKFVRSGSFAMGSGFELDDALGALVEVGAALVLGRAAVDVTLRYTWLSYEATDPATKGDANNIAALFGIHYVISSAR